MRIILVGCTAVLVLEFILHGTAMLIGMEAGIEPLVKHFGFRPGRATILLIGILDIGAAAGLTVGLWQPGTRIVTSGYSVLFFAVMMALRFRRRLGTLLRPPDFPLFLALSTLILAASLAN